MAELINWTLVQYPRTATTTKPSQHLLETCVHSPILYIFHPCALWAAHVPMKVEIVKVLTAQCNFDDHNAANDLRRRRLLLHIRLEFWAEKKIGISQEQIERVLECELISLRQAHFRGVLCENIASWPRCIAEREWVVKGRGKSYTVSQRISRSEYSIAMAHVARHALL